MSIKDNNNNIPDYWSKVKHFRKSKALDRANKEREWNKLLNTVDSGNQVQNIIPIDRKRIKDKSIKREQRIADETGGRRHAGSGSLWYNKSDASDPTFQYEDKFTGKPLYSLKLSNLYKIEEEALLSGKIPVFIVGFPNSKADFVILRDQDCLATTNNLIELVTTSKSISFKIEDMESYYLQAGGGIICSISFSNKDKYIVMMWKDFLGVKDKIAKGEVL